MEADISSISLRQREARKCGLCVVYIQKYGAMLLVGAWQHEKQQNKLVEWMNEWMFICHTVIYILQIRVTVKKSFKCK